MYHDTYPEPARGATRPRGAAAHTRAPDRVSAGDDPRARPLPGGVPGGDAHARLCRRPEPQYGVSCGGRALRAAPGRSEEHTSELQSLAYLVCRLLLEKKNKGAHLHLNLNKLGTMHLAAQPVRQETVTGAGSGLTEDSATATPAEPEVARRLEHSMVIA